MASADSTSIAGDGAKRERQRAYMREYMRRYRRKHRARVAAMRREREREKMQDPAYRNRMNAKAKRKRERVAADPNRLEHRKEWQREWIYARRHNPSFRCVQRERERAYERRRYATDAEYRERIKTRVRNRQSSIDYEGRRTRLRLLLLDAQGHRCGDLAKGGAWKSCGRSLYGIHVTAHVDHIIPKSRGGSDEPGNLQVLCATCNLRAHNHLMPSEFASVLVIPLLGAASKAV